MNIFRRLFKPSAKNPGGKKSAANDLNAFPLTSDFDFPDGTPARIDAYLLNAWVNIAVGILTRNIARAAFVIRRDGNGITGGTLYELFRRPNGQTSLFDLWKETSAWWFLEGEAFWWFGPDYSGGIPRNLYILDPRRLIHEERGTERFPLAPENSRRWFYQGTAGLVPILRDELVHFRDWNPWNPPRGINPLAALSLELEQDYYANKANSQLLKNNAIPQGILKTDQTIRPEEADALERRWESKYGAVKANRKIAVLGKGTEFKPLSFTPEVVKLFELKRWNLYTILAKYGIPPRVANINDKTTSLSGKDTREQHAAFWKYTLIPTLKQFESILETQFFARLGLKEYGAFDLKDIPELQESEDEQSRRDIAEINAGLKTINEVLRERGKDPKPWGDMWYRPKNLIPCGKEGR
ncbi:MAG: phage portal protein [Spirochaetaceae bacterium]|jgi:HK97 family phage portal protein|nr:phage portal protein [Spirochaetaceae bacterium]